MIFLTSCLYIILQDMLVNINICYSDMHFFSEKLFLQNCDICDNFIKK